MAVPITALIATMTRAVANVSFSACQANGFVIAFQNTAGPGMAVLEGEGDQRQRDHQAEIRRVAAPRSKRSPGAVIFGRVRATDVMAFAPGR